MPFSTLDSGHFLVAVVARAADVQLSERQRLVHQGPQRKKGHVAGGDEIARLGAGADELRLALGQQPGAVEVVRMVFHEGRRPQHHVSQPAGRQRLLHGVLGAEEVDGVIGGGAMG